MAIKVKITCLLDIAHVAVFDGVVGSLQSDNNSD